MPTTPTRSQFRHPRKAVRPLLSDGHDIERFALDAFAENHNAEQTANMVLAGAARALNRIAATAGLRPTFSEAEFKARLRGFSRHREMLQNSGGTYSADDAARRLAMSKSAVLKRAAKGRLLGLRGPRQNAVLFPVFQFEDGYSRLIPGLEQVLLELARQPILDDWAKCNFLLSRRNSLGGKAPIDLLREGKIETALALAHQYACK